VPTAVSSVSVRPGTKSAQVHPGQHIHTCPVPVISSEGARCHAPPGPPSVGQRLGPLGSRNEEQFTISAAITTALRSVGPVKLGHITCTSGGLGRGVRQCWCNATMQVIGSGATCLSPRAHNTTHTGITLRTTSDPPQQLCMITPHQPVTTAELERLGTVPVAQQLQGCHYWTDLQLGWGATPDNHTCVIGTGKGRAAPSTTRIDTHPSQKHVASTDSCTPRTDKRRLGSGSGLRS
jgi:hypothetical protein